MLPNHLPSCCHKGPRTPILAKLLQCCPWNHEETTGKKVASGGGKYSMCLVLLPEKKAKHDVRKYTVNFVVPNAAWWLSDVIQQAECKWQNYQVGDVLLPSHLPICKNQLFLPKVCPANQPRHWDGTRKKVTIQPDFPNVAPAQLHKFLAMLRLSGSLTPYIVQLTRKTWLQMDASFKHGSYGCL